MSLIHIFYLFTVFDTQSQKNLYLMVKKPQYLPNLVTRIENDKIPSSWLLSKIKSSYPELELNFKSLALSEAIGNGNKKFFVVNVSCLNEIEILNEDYVLASKEEIIKYLTNQKDLELKTISDGLIDALTTYEKNCMFLEN